MISLFSPYLWLAVILWSSTMLGMGYYQGHQHGKNGCLADQAVALEEAIQQAQGQALEQAKAELKTTQEFETAREKVRTVYVKIKEKADENIEHNPDYDHCSLDADGLRLYNARPTSTSSTPATDLADSPLSGSAGLSRRTAFDPVAQQPGALSDVLRVPGETQGAGGVGYPTTRKGE
ncbi:MULTISPECIES: hypothetical protein [Nitrosomonas]|uniref:DUF2570 domain-containing protein n=1 Tax=Nitrosomonas communis TaxID=44574 RepID=A0A0F7KAJ9_9PROT|nr:MULTISPECIES: hypothetical protein [Nitrosomonas]AKH37285.1 hypothetical protein AAW31_04870 [Nitrosomonas communis]TYP84719.1 hypothetical protein BCL69_103829 [Nitrosomonas communis]UVS62496.1 hypothetical protein NX761_05070 [Nitrosomonas sp. PLL12]